jgi:hypothetical protein
MLGEESEGIKGRQARTGEGCGGRNKENTKIHLEESWLRCDWKA